MLEAIEIPNTDFRAIRGETYTTVIDDSGNTVVVVPSSWTLFDIELWCHGYVIGSAQGQRAGRILGRQQAGRDIQAALGITCCMEGHKKA